MGQAICLRLATAHDSKVIFDWRNAASVRQHAFNSQLISWQDHVAWYQKKMADPLTRLWIIEDASNKPVGQVRLDADGEGKAVITISIDDANQGKGYGQQALRLACTRYSQEHPRVEIQAFVKKGNIASLRVFEKSGFVAIGTTQVMSQDCDQLILRK